MLGSLRSFLLLASVAFALLLVSTAGVLVQQAERAGRLQTQAQMIDTTRALALVVDNQMVAYEHLLRALAASEAMGRLDLDEIDRQARQALREEDAWITLSDRDGVQLINTLKPPGADLGRADLPASLWRELDTGRPRVCNLVAGIVERRVLCVDVPVMRDGRAAYMLSVVFRPRRLQQIVTAQRVPKERYATIVDREGRVVWRSVDPERYIGHAATPDMLSHMRRASEGIVASRSLDGVPTQAAYSRSPVSGWTFIVAVRESELASAGVATLRKGAVVAVLLLTAALVLALATGGLIRRDLKGLAAAARRIRAGDPPAFPPSRFEEFGALAAMLEEAVTERDDSRERFKLAQEAGGVGAWDWDFERDEGRVSDTYKRMHGLEDEQGLLKFRQVLEMIHPDDREGYLLRLSEAKSRREPTDNLYRVVRKDGSISWVSARGRPRFDAHGRAVSGAGIVRDVTAEHEAEAALRQLNGLLAEQVEARTHERDRLWNLAKDPFVVADVQGVWLAASPAWSVLLGHRLDAFIGRNSEWLEHPDDIAKTREAERRLVAGEATDRFENRLRAADGSYRWLSWSGVVEGGRLYSVARDITAEKAQAEALRAAELALRQSQKMEAIGQFTGGVAHDFNNLLTPIIGALDLMQRKGLSDDRTQRLVANAAEAAERARALVQRLLAFARRQPLRTELVDLGDGLQKLRPLLEASVGSLSRVDIQAPDDLPLVLADLPQLEMALINLAVNARDAMPKGGVLTVRARAALPADVEEKGLSSGRYVELSVADTGTGMPQPVLERAVEPFFSTKGLGRGTGLGLSSVHGLVAQLGGVMQIESAPGEGAAIRMWLPAAEGAVIALPGPRPPAGATAVRGRVLVVDDDGLARSSTAEMLAAAGYEVAETSSGQDALSELQAATFELLVTDHLMPGMSGVELARAAQAAQPGLQVLITSGYADVADIAPDLPRLAKPFTQAELQAAIFGGAADAPAPAPASTALVEAESTEDSALRS